MKPISLPPNPRRLRFTTRQHVRTANEFKRVYREGNRARGALMTVAVVTNGLGFSRLGLSIGRVVWKSAVKRNRVRRLFRESFRLELENLPVGVDIVLIAQPAIWPKLEDARTELVRLSKKAHRRYLEKLEKERESSPDLAEPSS